MTNPQRAKLAQLIRGRDGTDAELAATVNADAVTLVPRLINKTSIYAAIGLVDGLKLSGALEAMAASNDPATALQGREIIALLNPVGPGVDAASPVVRGVIDSFVANRVMSAEVAATIKGLGERRTLDFTATAADVAEAKEINRRIQQQGAAHRLLSAEYNRRVAVADDVLARLNDGELADVVEEL